MTFPVSPEQGGSTGLLLHATEMNQNVHGARTSSSTISGRGGDIDDVATAESVDRRHLPAHSLTFLVDAVNDTSCPSSDEDTTGPLWHNTNMDDELMTPSLVNRR